MSMFFKLDKEMIDAVEKAEALEVVSKNTRGEVKISKIIGDADSMIKRDKNGNDMMMFVLKVVEPDDQEYREIMYFLYMPWAGQTPGERQQNEYEFKLFHAAFGIKLQEEMAEDEYIGMSAGCIFGVTKDKESGENRNNIRKWVE